MPPFEARSLTASCLSRPSRCWQAASTEHQLSLTYREQRIVTSDSKCNVGQGTDAIRFDVRRSVGMAALQLYDRSGTGTDMSCCVLR